MSKLSSKLKQGEQLDDLLIENRKIIQNKSLYMFTSDSILLSRFAECKKTDRVIDLCSGSGIVGIHLFLLKKPKEVLFVEYQERLADMCSRTIEMNEFTNMKVLNRKLQGVHKELGCEIADVIVCNPPYEPVNNCEEIELSQQSSVSLARNEITVTFLEIACEVSKLLKFGGKFFAVLPAKRILEACKFLKQYKLEPKELKFVYEKNIASVVLIKAVKGGKEGLKVTLEH